MRISMIAASFLVVWASPSRADDAPAAKNEQQDEKAWKLKPPEISGFLQVHYKHSFDTSDDGVVDAGNFRVQRARIAFKGRVRPWLSYDLSIDPRAPALAGLLRDAYVGVRVIPRHEVRIGQQKTQFGYENNVSSSELYVVNRSELSDSLGRGLTLRDLGVGVVGRWPLGHGVRLEDGVTVVNGAGMNVQADDTRTKNVSGRIGVRVKRGDGWVRFGVSGSRGDFIDQGDDPIDPGDDFRVKFRRFGADLALDHRWVFVAAEYAMGEETVGAGEPDDLAGYYVTVVGKTPLHAGPVVRLDALGDELQRWTFGAYHGDPDAAVRVMLEYEYRALRDDVRADDKLYLWMQVRF